MAVPFTMRTTAPSQTNKYYIKRNDEFNGYNRCMLINSRTGSVLPNCVGYAWGRYCEEQGIHDCNLSRGDAQNWYGKNDGYARGNTPKLGAVICWRNPKTGGHVAIVEKIYNDGRILTSNSAYGGKRFYTKTLNRSNSYYMGDGYTYQGFIYPDTQFTDSDEPVPPTPQLRKIEKKYPWFIQYRKLRKKTLLN